MQEVVIRGPGPNALSIESLEALCRDLDSVKNEPFVLRGAGSAFSAGLDLRALRNASSEEVARLLDSMGRAALAVFLHPHPTVALIHGHAIAGGCLLAQACDVRLASDLPSLRVGMTGVELGLTYPPFVYAILSARLPTPSLEHVLCGARRHTPIEARALGLVDEIVPADQLEARASLVLRERAALPRTAYSQAKRTLRTPFTAQLNAQQSAFDREVVPSWTAALRR